MDQIPTDDITISHRTSLLDHSKKNKKTRTHILLVQIVSRTVSAFSFSLLVIESPSNVI